MKNVDALYYRAETIVIIIKRNRLLVLSVLENVVRVKVILRNEKNPGKITRKRRNLLFGSGGDFQFRAR